MRGRLLETTLWAGALAFGSVAMIRWRAAVPKPSPSAAAMSSVVRVASRPTADALDAAARATVDRDPFRLERKPATVAYRPDLEGTPPPPRPPRPNLAVTGIVGGPQWEAVLEGVPGREGSVVVRRGDVLGELHIRRISRDTVIVQGPDTIWKLTVRRAW